MIAKRNTLFTLALLAVSVLAGGLSADQIDLKNAAFEGVINNFNPETLEITIRVRASQFEKSIAEVTKISIKGEDELNKAEAAADSNKIGPAIKLYGAAYKAADKEWLKDLVMVRRYQALGKIKRIDISLKAWLALVAKFGPSQAVLAIAPNNTASAGSKANATGLQMVDAKVKQLAADRKKNRDFIEALLKVKMAIQNAEGNDSAAGETAMMLSDLDNANLTGEAPKAAASEDAPAADTETASADDEDDDEDAPAGDVDLKIMAQLLKAGKYDKVIQTLQANMDEFDDFDLPDVLILLAKAQVVKASRTKDKALLVDAGLNLMMAYSNFSGEPGGPEALYLASKINGMLGQKNAQKAALKLLVDEYAESNVKGATEWAKRGSAELETLKK